MANMSALLFVGLILMCLLLGSCGEMSSGRGAAPAPPGPSASPADEAPLW